MVELFIGFSNIPKYFHIAKKKESQKQVAIRVSQLITTLLFICNPNNEIIRLLLQNITLIKIKFYKCKNTNTEQVNETLPCRCYLPLNLLHIQVGIKRELHKEPFSNYCFSYMNVLQVSFFIL